MSLKLYFHPLSSFCHKVLIALYENDTPFEPHLVDLWTRARARRSGRSGRSANFPCCATRRAGTIPESSIIIEYLDQHYPGKTRLMPEDAELAREVRLRDRFFDLYIHLPMQKIVGDRLRPRRPRTIRTASAGKSAAAETALRHGRRRRWLASTWAMGETFTMADCAAAPALFYADKVLPLGAPTRTPPHISTA